MEFRYVKLEIYVPESHFDAVREALGKTDAGHIGNYDSCLSYAGCMGMWRPLAGARPFLGESGRLSIEPEIKIEVVCPVDTAGKTVEEVKKAHPYEEPVINVIPLLGTTFDFSVL